ncbi:MAG: serine/threonine protein kinase [Planctomycetes bacterium]|nr:serine/threonine protein kinase [Planctomycetota bacterium]
MSDNTPLSHIDVTLDARRDDSNSMVSSGNTSRGTGTAHPCAQVALIEGSGAAINEETRSLLQSRLRIAASVIAGGFAAFLTYRFLNPQFRDPVDRHLNLVQLGVTLLLATMSGLLFRRCQPSLAALRIKETLIFLVPAAFFVLINAVEIDRIATKAKMIPNVIAPWILLMFVYTMFIPNRWRRAAAVLGGMAAGPVLLLAAMWWLDDAVRDVLNTDFSSIIEWTLLLSITVAVGAIGTHTIGRLRRQVFEARQLGQYRLRRLIGSGGMGEVHLAEHRLMKRPVAIKLIRPEKAGDPKVLARFEREVRATAKLSHWNTIEIFDYGRSDDGTFYYVMEFLPGMSLADLVKTHGPLPPGRAIYLLRQVCDALNEAHQANLVHRDLKPGNIFAAQRGGIYDVAKLLDFGLVKPIADIESTQLTQEGSITGSPLYMSPEQATGEADSDPRSDVYSLGAVAYYLLTGCPPFDGDKPLKVIIAHSNEKPVAPSQRRSEIPHDLDMVVLKCLEKSLDDRFQTIADLEAALAGCEAAGEWSREQAAQWWEAKGLLTDPEVLVEAQV